MAFSENLNFICKDPGFLLEIVHARVCHGSHYKCTLHSEALFQLRLRPQFCRVHTWKNIRKEIGIKINHNLLELTYATFRWAFYGLFTKEKRLLKIMGFYDLFVTEIAFCLNKKKTKSLADLTFLVPNIDQFGISIHTFKPRKSSNLPTASGFFFSIEKGRYLGWTVNSFKDGNPHGRWGLPRKVFSVAFWHYTTFIRQTQKVVEELNLDWLAAANLVLYSLWSLIYILIHSHFYETFLIVL